MMAVKVDCRAFLWRCLDGFICIFILAPLVVVYWRGSFQLLDVYTLPANQTHPSDLSNLPVLKTSAFISISIGIVGTVIINLLQTSFHDKIHQHQSKFAEIILKRCYTYIYGWIIVNHWRGVWRLWDAYTGMTVESNIVSFSFGCFCLIVLMSFRNIVGPPLVTVSDFDQTHFAVKTRFRTKPSKPFLHVLDTLFSVAVPGSLVVGVWRGQWGILDHIFLLDSYRLSLSISCLVGFGIIVLLFLLQWPAAFLSTAMEKNHCQFIKIIFEDVFLYIAAFGAVNIWRGVWGFCDQLIYPNPQDYALSNFICHLIGAFGTMLLLHGNSVLVRDVQIDGEFRNGQGCWFVSRSLTLLERKMQKKQVPPVTINSSSSQNNLQNPPEETSKMLPSMEVITK